MESAMTGLFFGWRGFGDFLAVMFSLVRISGGSRISGVCPARIVSNGTTLILRFGGKKIPLPGGGAAWSHFAPLKVKGFTM